VITAFRLSTKFNELQELQARQEAATRQADSSFFDLTCHLREEQRVNDSLRAQLSTLEHLKLKCLDEITSRTQQVRLLQHRLLDAESHLATRDPAQLDLKQENEEMLRQLTDMRTKFDQCQTKLLALENFTVSAELYHMIVRAQQELSQQAMSAGKSQNVALDSMQQEISALSERNDSLRHGHEELE
jgi:chromosome segregation ATPase